MSLSAVGAAYDAGRRRMSDLVRDLDDDAASTRVPACPEWSVHDLVAHVTGICADILAGNMDGVTTDPWTRAQVEARRAVPLPAVLNEWANVGGQVAAMIDDTVAQLVFDLATHEHDLRGALGQAGARDSDAVHIAIGWVAPAVVAVANDGRLDLRLEAGGRSWGDEGGLRLRAEPFELMRALSGRRSEAQLRAMDWSGDPSAAVAALAHYGPFSLPAADLSD